MAIGPVMAAASVGGDPDPGIADDVAHLQHTGADALRYQTAPAIFTEAHDGEAHHLSAAACHGGTAGKTRQTQRRADGGGGDGQRQCHAHHHGHQDAHQQRAEKALRHGAHGVDEIAFGGEYHILPFQESANFIHIRTSYFRGDPRLYHVTAKARRFLRPFPPPSPRR